MQVAWQRDIASLLGTVRSGTDLSVTPRRLSVRLPSSSSSSGDTPSGGGSSFVFGAAGAPSAAAGQFHFSGVKPKSPVKPSRSRDVSLNESTGGDDNDYYEGDEGEHLLFEPVIPLPDKVSKDAVNCCSAADVS